MAMAAAHCAVLLRSYEINLMHVAGIKMKIALLVRAAAASLNMTIFT